MDKRRNRDQIQSALNTTLSGLRDDPWLAQRVIAEAKGTRKVKKKISVGLVLALVLILASSIALAVLSLNAYYESVLETEGKEGLIENWSAESLAQLVDWMSETGIELDEAKLTELHDTTQPDDERRAIALELIEGYYTSRDGVLTSVDIIAKEKGPIEYWSLEDKNWLSDMLAQYQPEEIAVGRNLLPEETDISQEEAEEVFFKALQEKYGQTRSDMDMDTLTASFGVSRFTIDTTTEFIRHWTINVETKDHQDTAGAYIRANGELIQIISSSAEQRTWLDQYADDHSALNARTSAAGFYNLLHKWQPILKELIESGEINPDQRPYANSDIMYWYSITDVVGLPEESDLSQDEARALADEAIRRELNWTEEELFCFTPWVSYRTDDSVQPVYWFVYRWHGMNNAYELFTEGRITRKVVVKIDAQTGEVVELTADNEIYVDGGRGNSVGM